MKKLILDYWHQLQVRERLVLGWGGLAVGLILFYAVLWQPWHKAIDHMEMALPDLRSNLVWMRQQSELIKSGVTTSSSVNLKGRSQSLLSVIEQTAKASSVRDAIQQMVPGQSDTEVRVILEEVSFNNWVKWVDLLFRQYGVNIKQVSAERDDEQPNIAEIRMTFERL
ncbi:MAG: general secretion pathway protein M [Cryomorphaceae bacterium]